MCNSYQHFFHGTIKGSSRKPQKMLQSLTVGKFPSCLSSPLKQAFPYEELFPHSGGAKIGAWAKKKNWWGRGWCGQRGNATTTCFVGVFALAQESLLFSLCASCYHSLRVLRMRTKPMSAEATIPLDWFPWSWTAWSWSVGSRSAVFSPALLTIEEPDERSSAEPTWSEEGKAKKKPREFGCLVIWRVLLKFLRLKLLGRLS